MRIVAGGSLFINGVETLQSGQVANSATIFGLFAIADGALLVVGMWTPVAGFLVVAISVFGLFVQHDNLCPCFLLAAVGAALALVGPGALSIDARLFGWKRIDLDK